MSSLFNKGRRSLLAPRNDSNVGLPKNPVTLAINNTTLAAELQRARAEKAEGEKKIRSLEIRVHNLEMELVEKKRTSREAWDLALRLQDRLTEVGRLANLSDLPLKAHLIKTPAQDRPKRLSAAEAHRERSLATLSAEEDEPGLSPIIEGNTPGDHTRTPLPPPQPLPLPQAPGPLRLPSHSPESPDSPPDPVVAKPPAKRRSMVPTAAKPPPPKPHTAADALPDLPSRVTQRHKRLSTLLPRPPLGSPPPEDHMDLVEEEEDEVDEEEDEVDEEEGEVDEEEDEVGEEEGKVDEPHASHKGQEGEDVHDPPQYEPMEEGEEMAQLMGFFPGCTEQVDEVRNAPWSPPIHGPHRRHAPPAQASHRRSSAGPPSAAAPAPGRENHPAPAQPPKDPVKEVAPPAPAKKLKTTDLTAEPEPKSAEKKPKEKAGKTKPKELKTADHTTEPTPKTPEKKPKETAKKVKPDELKTANATAESEPTKAEKKPKEKADEKVDRTKPKDKVEVKEAKKKTEEKKKAVKGGAVKRPAVADEAVVEAPVEEVAEAEVGEAPPAVAKGRGPSRAPTPPVTVTRPSAAAEAEGPRVRRSRAQTVSYAEPSLNKKLRRE